MKIGDQKPVPPGANGVESVGGPTEPTSGADFSERLRDVDPTEGEVGPGRLGEIEALAARIDRGELDPAEAMRLLVDQVVNAKLGPDAPSELRVKARDFVESALADDPHLRSLVQRLGGRE
ncbi:MAG: hypothetical protein ABI333_19990 [bacterium]